MSDETLRAFSAEAKTRADRTMNDYVYAFDLHGKTTLYASDLAKVIADRDDLLAALEPMLKHAIERCSDAPEWTPRDAVTCIFTIEELEAARAAIARAKGGDT